MPAPLNPPNLPVELYVQILCDLPAGEQTNLKTVVSFLSTSTTLRAAALENSVWARLYQSYYPHHDEVKEKERRDRLQGNARLMFIERYKADRKALLLLDHVRVDPWGRHPLGPQLVQQMSYDICDALERETRLPIPKVFRDPLADDMQEEAAPEALPRRFWASAMRGATARYYAIKKWQDVCARPEDHTFEDVLLGFSAFMPDAVLPQEALQQIDELAALCRQRLSAKGVQVDPENPDFNLRAVVLAIRDFLREEGFALATRGSFQNPLHQFPHYFLGPGRSSTLPISISWTFVAICRRLGLQAAPTNTPGRVLSHITSPHPRHGDMLLDVCTQAPPTVFSSKDVEIMLAEAGMLPDMGPDAVRPARLPAMLRRAAYNLYNAVHALAEVYGSLYWSAYAAQLAMYTVNLQGQRVAGTSLETALPRYYPLDADVLLDVLAVGSLPSSQVEKMDMFALGGVQGELEGGPHHRSPSVQTPFIGQVVADEPSPTHPGCVFLWKSMAGKAQPGLGPDSSQRTYFILSGPRDMWEWRQSGGSLWSAVPLTAKNARELRERSVCFDRYFEDAIIPREDGTGARFIPSRELQAAYPDDLEYGARWTASELEKAGA
ncbi:hypothetical protein C2E23DRAFT_157758 [Lenzites betulinus]|nr:hypothetical protein C2E23DRAFT_157758 [Lenzites betulinus]